MKKYDRIEPYFPVAYTDEGLVTKSRHVSGNAKQDLCCPRITRGKLMGAVMFLLAFVCAVLYTCYSSVCCQGVARQIVIQSDQSIPEGRIRYKHTQRRLPQCIIIGVRKGGTRALLEFLNIHPAIQAERSEMHFFDDDAMYNNGLEWYRRKMPFSFPGQITIEKTPAYFTAVNVPERIYHMNKTIKLLLILRDPIERMVSDYTQIFNNKREKGKDFIKFEDLVLDIYGNVNKSYKAVKRSMYYKHMERWLHFFPLSQFHFVNGEQLVEDPSSELRKVEDFLGIEHELTQEKFYFNKTRGFYCMHLDNKEKCLAKSKGRDHPEVNPEVIKKLRVFFEPLNQKLFTMIQRTFDWPSK